jgi:ATP-dependent Zn protease
MGGMVAEELFFGEAGTGPSGDLQAATQAACQMVGSLGMAGSLISYDAMAVAGAQNVVAKVLATDTGREAVDRILNDAKSAVQRMLDENRHVVEALRDALLERDELLGDEIVAVVDAARHPENVDVRGDAATL